MGHQPEVSDLMTLILVQPLFFSHFESYNTFLKKKKTLHYVTVCSSYIFVAVIKHSGQNCYKMKKVFGVFFFEETAGHSPSLMELRQGLEGSLLSIPYSINPAK